jgi:carboxypeptidase Taq
VEPALAELKDRLGKVSDIRRAQSLLLWDMTVYMPPGGAPTRAAQLATLEEIHHEHFVDERLGELFEELEPHLEALPADSDDGALVRVARRDWNRSRRVPAGLAVELATVTAQAYEIWVKAREESDFEHFRPSLERVVELRQHYVECFAPYDDLYDTLLEDYEPGMRTSEIREIFAVLTPALRELVAGHATDEDDEFMRGPFAIAAQEALSRELCEAFGATWDQFRLDRTVHPYEVTLGLGDVRLTTRYLEDDLSSLFTAMHECGHGLYEWGVSPTLERTPLCSGASMTLHESQSRLWENVVGRSLPFWRWFYPRVQASFPGPLGDVGLEDFHRAVNRVRRTFIRVDADETSYGLHVILRFELEQELLSGRLAVKDLPDAWNTRFEELMGITVPNDAMGVLQDSHWSSGSFGYFPTYLLGTVLSVQIWDTVRAVIPDVETHF